MNHSISCIRPSLPKGIIAVVLFSLFIASSPAAVISHVYGVPLSISFFKRSDLKYIIDGIVYRFKDVQPPFDVDFDQNGSTDLTFNSNGRSGFTYAIFVTLHGRNQVWSLAGGA